MSAKKILTAAEANQPGNVHRVVRGSSVTLDTETLWAHVPIRYVKTKRHSVLGTLYGVAIGEGSRKYDYIDGMPYHDIEEYICALEGYSDLYWLI